MLEQTLPVLRETRRIKRRLLEVHIEKPPEQDVVVEHLAEQPIRAHRVQRNQQQTLQQPLRRYRRSARVAVHPIEHGREFLQNRIGVGLDGAQRMLLRNALLRREVAEHMTLPIVLAAHRGSPVASLTDFIQIPAWRGFSAAC